MKDRILKFLESEHISPSEFADKIGVQRSSMSHILNGRNFPSATFIQKMLQSFPMVNSRWLLIGEGEMNLNIGRVTGNQIDIEFEQPVNRIEEVIKEPVSEAETMSPNISEKSIDSDNKAISSKSSEINPPKEKEIEQILFFYKDKTFNIYRPS
jgi:transcriptional regulator with XRE-family HTH domain